MRCGGWPANLNLSQKWYAGAPYLWGGRTEWGIDCSGLVQAVYSARGIRLPRDSDQQFGQGKEIAMSPDGTGYGAGDLLFFAERGRVSHVALWAGAGRIVHAALSRGGGPSVWRWAAHGKAARDPGWGSKTGIGVRCQVSGP